MASGGKRKGAGRKPSPDKKQTVALYIETSIINNMGGMEAAKEILYSFAKTEAGRQKNKNTCSKDDKCTDPLCNLHIVSIAQRRFAVANASILNVKFQRQNGC